MTWYKIAFTPSEVASNAHFRCQKILAARLAQDGHSADTAVFSRNEDDGFHTVIYVTPDTGRICRDIVEQFAGVPCGPPPRTGTALLIGRGSPFDFLAPDVSPEAPADAS